MAVTTEDIKITTNVRPRTGIRARLLGWHRSLAIVGAIALGIWGSSGLLHILASSLGPQQTVFFPPQRAVDLQDTLPIPEILAAAGIQQAAAVQVVAAERGSLLQVTEAPEQPRRYFDLHQGRELPGHDRLQAEFLARHYLATEAPVDNATLQHEFSSEYPWVNRLLPVWRIEFDTDDRLVAFVYTELNALAYSTNRLKTRLQLGFQWLHTWSWMPRLAEPLRVALIVLLVGSFLALAIVGLGMLATIRRKRRATGTRGWHRLTAWVLGIPLVLLSFSGLLHLVYSSLNEEASHLRLGQAMDMQAPGFDLAGQWPELSAGLNVNSVSMIETAQGTSLVRLGLAPERRGGPVTPRQIRNARFEGVETTGPAVYLRADTGQPWPHGDRELALQHAQRHTGIDRDAISEVALITRFGSGYDFRNKRLPVWRIDYGSPHDEAVFIDTRGGVLVDRMPDWRRPEQQVFTLLHKWNFLRPLGRNAPNWTLFAVVSLALTGFMAMGLTLDWRRRRALRKPNTLPTQG